MSCNDDSEGVATDEEDALRVLRRLACLTSSKQKRFAPHLLQVVHNLIGAGKKFGERGGHGFEFYITGYITIKMTVKQFYVASYVAFMSMTGCH